VIRIGWTLQCVGVAMIVFILASGFVFAWPQGGTQPGVSSGPSAPVWGLALAAGVLLTFLGSLRWLAAGLLLVIVAIGSIAAGLISRLLTGTAVSSGLSAGIVVAAGGVLIVAGFLLVEVARWRSDSGPVETGSPFGAR
jgi:hypothetical protein